MTVLEAVPVACPRCARPRVADGVLLVCLPCREAWPLEGREAPSLTVTSLGLAGVPGGPAVPFYRFPALEARARSLAPEGAGAAARLDALRVGWVLGVRIRRFENYGDAGLEYTRRPPRLAPRAVERVLGVGRTPADAASILGVHLHRLALELAPPGALRLDPVPGSPELVFITSLVDGDHLKLPHSPIRYPASHVEGYWRSTTGA